MAWIHNQAYLKLCLTLVYTTVTNSEQLAYLEPEASSAVCGTREMIMHIQSPSIVGTVYLSIFKDT